METPSPKTVTTSRKRSREEDVTPPKKKHKLNPKPTSPKRKQSENLEEDLPPKPKKKKGVTVESLQVELVAARKESEKTSKKLVKKLAKLAAVREELEKTSKKFVKKLAKLDAVREELEKTSQKLVKATRVRKPLHPIVLGKYEGFDSTLEVWLNKLYARKPPLSTYTCPGCGSTVKLVRSKVKKAIRSVLSFAYDAQEIGFCITSDTIGLENMVVSHGKLRFRSLHLDKLGSPFDEEKFKWIRCFILSTFFKGVVNDLPIDMSRFLDLLENRPSAKRLLINNHFALMNVRARRNFISQWRDIVHQYTVGEWRQYIQACKKLPHRNDWFMFNPQCPLAQIYNNGQKKKLYKGKPEDQPRCFRNSVTHLLDDCQMGVYQGPALYLYDDCVNIVLTESLESISVFYELLNKKRLLTTFKPGKFF